MIMASLQVAAKALGGEVSRGQVVCPGPGHSPVDRSLAVRFDHRAPDGFMVTSFAGDDWQACRDYVRDKLGIRRDFPDDRKVQRPDYRVDSKTDDADRTARALAIWREAEDPREELVDVYLRSRGVRLTNEIANEVIRFHHQCPFKGQRIPAMVALVRDIATNAPKAIHRTALTADGRKAVVDGVSRLSLGPVGGGAVKLTDDADVTTCLGIGEGIESTLSLRLAPEFGASPIWALLSASQLGAFPVLSGIESLWIAVDHDPAGIKAADECADRWRKAGREVFLVRPNVVRADLNDLARGG